jgi:hypothetical protein
MTAVSAGKGCSLMPSVLDMNNEVNKTKIYFHYLASAIGRSEVAVNLLCRGCGDKDVMTVK